MTDSTPGESSLAGERVAEWDGNAKLVRTRRAGRCSNIFAHPDRIDRGDLVRVTTIFPGHDVVPGWTRVRECNWCLVQQCKLHHRSDYACEGCRYVQQPHDSETGDDRG